MYAIGYLLFSAANGENDKIVIKNKIENRDFRRCMRHNNIRTKRKWIRKKTI